MKNERPLPRQLSPPLMYSGRLLHMCEIMRLGAHLNIRMTDYEGGMREHNPSGAASEKERTER